MAMNVITLGYSRTSTAESDAYHSYTTPSSTVSAILKNLGPNAIAIAGRTFAVDTSFEPYRREAFRHKSLPAQRQSINLTNIAGQGTVNTEGLWRREQTDWSAGAGQKYLDRKESNMPHRFYKSKGMDVFSVDMQATLLHDTVQFRSSTNTNLQIVRCDGYLFMIDGTSVVYTPTHGTGAYSTFTTMGTPTGVTAYYSICANDTRVFVATNNGIYYITLSGGSPTTTWSSWCGNDSSTGFTGYNLVRYCNERVVAASGNYLYLFATTHTIPSTAAPGLSDTLMVHPNSGWVWSDATGGSSQIYFGGYVNQGGVPGYSAVFRAGIPQNSANTPWVPYYPVQALPMPLGEAVYSLESYLNYIFIGTSNGIRMAQTLSVYDPNATQAGDLKAGNYVPNLTQPVTSPVRAIVGDGRFVLFGWSNYDSNSTGLGKLDLSTFIAGDPLAPVYASDLMASGQGEILSMDWDTYNDLPVFAVSGAGFYKKDPVHYVHSGSIDSGGFTYGIPDHKIPVFFDYGVDFPAGSGAQVSATVTTEPFDASSSHSMSVPAATADLITEQYLPQGSAYLAETFNATVTLTSTTDRTDTPSLFRWTLKAWPTAVSETSIMVPLQLFSVNVIDGMEVFADPYDSFMFLENLRQTQQIVIYQEGSLTADVIIETLDFLPHKRRGGYENGFEGDCVVTLKTIGGYNSYSGIPTL
jgi:hypothetical protein